MIGCFIPKSIQNVSDPRELLMSLVFAHLDFIITLYQIIQVGQMQVEGRLSLTNLPGTGL